MRNKKLLYTITLLIGICLAAAGVFLIKGEDLKAVSGVCIGIGAGLFGMSISNLYMNRFYKKNPDVARIKEIEVNDERNTAIRNRAKAKAADITQYLIIIITYITILIKAPLWVTLATIGVYLAYSVLGIIFMTKYNKEM